MAVLPNVDDAVAGLPDRTAVALRAYLAELTVRVDAFAGPTGPTGAAGPTGPTGPTGPAGP